MRTVSKTAAKILNVLTAEMEPGQVRRIGEKDGAFMQVVVERLTDRMYSVSHYYEQNGDLVPDPDMSFWRHSPGAWVPLGITQWCGHQQAVRLDSYGEPGRYSPGLVRDLCAFTTTWMRNIKQQQDLRHLPAPQ